MSPAFWQLYRTGGLAGQKYCLAQKRMYFRAQLQNWRVSNLVEQCSEKWCRTKRCMSGRSEGTDVGWSYARRFNLNAALIEFTSNWGLESVRHPRAHNQRRMWWCRGCEWDDPLTAKSLNRKAELQSGVRFQCPSENLHVVNPPNVNGHSLLL